MINENNRTALVLCISLIYFLCNALSASVTAVFKMDVEGTEKRFTRTVQGSSSDYRINDEVYSCILNNNLFINITIIILVYFKSRIFCSVGTDRS